VSGLKLKLKASNADEAKKTESKATGQGTVTNLKLLNKESEKTERSSSNNKKKKSNRYFYKVSNHHELFKIGRSFYNDYMAGVKSFAITSTGYQTSQQKTILGLASFFDHKEDLKIGIISDNLNQGAFKDIVSISKTVQYDYFGPDKSIEIKSFYNHFEFLDLLEILKLANDRELGEYDDVFDQIVDLYDIVFWDVPELHNIQIDSEKYFPVIMKFESISIIVAQSLTKRSDVEDIKKFFLGYGINLKGLLLEEKTSLEKSGEKPINNKEKAKKVTKKKFWWQRFFKSK
jgi:hypothetical protein